MKAIKSFQFSVGSIIRNKFINNMSKDNTKNLDNQGINEENASEVSVKFQDYNFEIPIKEKDVNFKFKKIGKGFQDWYFSDLEKHLGTIEALKKINEYRKIPDFKDCFLLKDYDKYLHNLTSIKEVKTVNKPKKQKEFQSFFKSSTLDQTIKKGLDAPPMTYLFSNFISQGELSICFADNGAGKSILAVQIAEGLANNKHILNMPNDSIEKMKVLYYDFEMSEIAFKNRYTHKESNQTFLNFGQNLIRMELDLDKVVYDDHFTNNFVNSIEDDIIRHEANFIIIDNLKAISLKSSSDTNVAILVMRKLNELKKNLGITILALGHTGKIYNTKPLVKEDLKGAKEMSDFADSVFAIGRSVQGNNIRYIKHLKSRNSEEKYHSQNTITCEIMQHENGYLKFNFMDFQDENMHLISKSQEDKPKKKEIIKELLDEGKSQREIADIVQMSVGTVNAIIKKLETSF